MKMLRRIPLTLKVVLLTVAVALLSWGLLEYVHNRRLSSIFDAQLNKQLVLRTQEARVRFDRYIAAYSDAAEITVSQKRFADYISGRNLNSAGKMRFYQEIPPWMPNRSVMRRLVRVSYAFLISGDGSIGEIYQGVPEPLPPTLLKPGSLLRALSFNQSLLTSIDDIPFVITAKPVLEDGRIRAIVMFASPLDDDFLADSQGFAGGKRDIVVLISQNTITASSRPDVLPGGTPLEAARRDYVVMGKSFFDTGSSDLLLEFASLMSKREYEALGGEILAAGRRNRLGLTIAFIVIFSIVMSRITHRIQALTRRVSHFSEKKLGGLPTSPGRGDELDILDGNFGRLTEEVALATDRLRRARDDLALRVEERTRTLAALSSRHQAILSAVPDIIMEVDKNKVYTWANQAGLDFFGEDVVGREAALYFAGEQDTYAAVQPLFEGRADVIYVESWQRRRDGQKRLLAWWCRVLKDAEGAVAGALSSARDITESKQAEKRLQSLVSDLERSNRELEQFAYVASHDLQEPLRMVASYVQLLERKYKGRLDRNADTYIGFAVDGALRMHKLIDGLLAYSRIPRGAEFSTVDVNAVFAGVVTNLSAAIRENHASVTRDALPAVSGDETQLMRLLQNLIGNALRYRRPDIPPRVHVSAERRGGEWIFSVRDNGIGIEPRYFSRIFLIFQRLHSREEYPGTGIGLALCKRIVERHHGRIWVESVPGEGSTFLFTIPVQKNNGEQDEIETERRKR